MEQNSHLFHVTQHLEAFLCFFKDFHVYREYIRQLSRARENTTVKLLFYAIMPNHVHLLVRVEKAEDLPNFMLRVNSGFCSRIRHMKDTSGNPIFTGKKVFMEGPAYIPIYTYRGFFTTLRYIYQNPNDKESWATAAYQLEKGFRDFDMKELFQITQMDWAELRTILKKSDISFQRYIEGREWNNEKEKEIFLILPET